MVVRADSIGVQDLRIDSKFEKHYLGLLDYLTLMIEEFPFSSSR